ncbi:DUF4011 domain-containing protein [Demequina sp. NBRC 110054]|uniref:DUF4011 domain-containing protein n=1 Tax=Demequina sp. NBRC 110054 TaxID=1570343 RepID=UPI0009FF35A1|nr:DUF4011 domain-containing protein [Demequina sp. NBRC 110054]
MTDYIGRALVADALREWRDQLRQHSSESSLRDLAGSSHDIVDLRSAHPGGLAPLFAGRPTPITQLIREGEAREEALGRTRRMLAEGSRIHAATGAWTVALAIGTVSWDEDGHRRELPLLLRPVSLEQGRDREVLLTLHDEARVNPVFAAELRARGDEETIARTMPAVGSGHEFDPRPLWEAVSERTDLFGESLEAPERLVLGVFDDPEQRLLDDLDDLDTVIAASDVLVAASGDQDATGSLAMPLPAFPVGDRDPFAERGLGDLDDAQFAALDLIATGRHVFLQSPPGADSAGMAAAIAADGAASGRTVGVVAGQEAMLHDIHARMVAQGTSDLAIDAAVEAWNSEARTRLLEAITLGSPAVDDDMLRKQGEDLLTARYRLHARFDALHRVHRPWGVSAFEAVQALVRLTTGKPQPSTTVRLGPDAGLLVAERGFSAVAQALHLKVMGGSATSAIPVVDAPTPDAPRDAWWRDVTDSPEEGVRFDEALGALLSRHLPKMRLEAASASHETGVDEAPDLTTWADQVRLFEDIRDTLEVFSPAVFHRSLHDLVAATAPDGSTRHERMPRRDRKALVRRAVELLRPGRSKDQLHDHLVAAHDVSVRWRAHCSAGGWPVVPDDFDLYGSRLDEAGEAWSTIAEAVAKVSGEQDLPSTSWERMNSALERLAGGLTAAIEQVSETPLGVDLEEAGFGLLIEGLNGTDPDLTQVRVDLEFAWWAAAFDAIVQADPRLTQYGALADAVHDFERRDREFSESRVQPLMRAAAERRRAAIARHPEMARDLFALLVERSEATYRELWQDFQPLVSALRPVSLVRAEQVSRLMPPTRVLDVLVVVASESLALAELVPAIARAKQVVVIGDAHTATRSAVAALAHLLPQVTLPALPQPRDPRVTGVLQDVVYGRSLSGLPAAGEPESLAVQLLDTTGTPAAGMAEVETTPLEVRTVVDHLVRSIEDEPSRSILVVAGNPLHALRLREALEARDEHLGAFIPIVVIGEAAGYSVDDVVMSWGWACDDKGDVPRRLGALSAEGGEQAFTQALVAGQERTWVFNALTPTHLDDIAVRADAGHGVALLRQLLVAASSPVVPSERREPAPTDWLLADIAARLRRYDCQVRLRYGSGSDSIPMVVGRPDDEGYRLAVVTDEASTAMSASLRDRVRWQRTRLEALGWTVLPLWTLDVFMDPEAAARYVLDALSVTEAPAVTASISLPHIAPSDLREEEPEVVEDASEDDEQIDGQQVFDLDVERVPVVESAEELVLDDTAATGIVAELRPELEPEEPEAVEASDAPEEAPAETAPLTLGLGPMLLGAAAAQRVDVEPEPEPETATEAEADAEVEAEVEVDAEPEAETEAEPEIATEVEAEAEADAAPEPEPETEPEPEPRLKPAASMGFGAPKLAVPLRRETPEPVTPSAASPEDESPAEETSAVDPEPTAEDAEVEAELAESADVSEPESKDEPTAPSGVPAPQVARGADRPLIPTRAWEDEDAGWGGSGSGRSRDDEIRGDKPPHW